MIKKHRKFHSQQGSSLLEILIVVVVLTVGIVALFTFQVDVKSGNTIAAQNTEASHLAQQKIEELQAADYQALASSNGTTVVGSGQNTEYRLSWTVTPSGDGENYVDIQVNVQWDDTKSEAHEINLHTVANESQPLHIAAIAVPLQIEGNGCPADNGGNDGIDDDADNNGNDDGNNDDGNNDDTIILDNNGDDGINDDTDGDGSDDGNSDDGTDDDGINDDTDGDGNDDGENDDTLILGC